MKSNVYRIILGILFPVLFIFLFILFAGFDHGTTCWIGFGSLFFSYIIMLASPLLVPSSKSSHLFSFTSGTITSIYFGANLIIGLILILWDFEQWKIAVAIESILLVVFLMFFLPILITDEETAKKENVRQNQIYTVKAFIARAKIIADRANDMQIKKDILRIYDELKSCPSNSNSATNTIDNSISKKLEQLESLVVSANYAETNKTIKELLNLIKERKELSRF